MANAAPQSTPTEDTRCHFFKLSLELRDEIYDYVAYEQTSVDLYVNLETPAEPKVYAYDEGRALSRTSSQIRTEYMTRLQRRIKRLDIDNRARVVPRYLVSSYSFPSLLIAERKVSKYVWVQDDVALRWTIIFEGVFDNGQRRITLRFTVASGAARTSNQKMIIPTGRRFGVSVGDLLSAMTYLQRLADVADRDERNWWMTWWHEYEVEVLYCRLDKDDLVVGDGFYWIPEESTVRES
jgi:hypothetical protein